MTKRKFTSIARQTLDAFWPACSHHLTPEQNHYLKSSPAVRRNLQARIVYALAQTLLTPKQVADLNFPHPSEPQLRFEEPKL